MNLTDLQHDALTELINIGYARAAGALSQLTGYRVALEVPKLSIHPLSQIAPLLSRSGRSDVIAVSQVFSGVVAGNALLVLDRESAGIVVDLLTDDVGEVGDWPDDRREVISEVGHILLNACLGVFGNLLQVKVTFSLPLLHIAELQTVLQSTTVARQNLSHALVIHTRLHIREQNLTGHLVIILGVTSLERLLHGIDEWQQRALEG